MAQINVSSAELNHFNFDLIPGRCNYLFLLNIIYDFFIYISCNSKMVGHTSLSFKYPWVSFSDPVKEELFNQATTTFYCMYSVKVPWVCCKEQDLGQV